MAKLLCKGIPLCEAWGDSCPLAIALLGYKGWVSLGLSGDCNATWLTGTAGLKFQCSRLSHQWTAWLENHMCWVPWALTVVMSGERGNSHTTCFQRESYSYGLFHFPSFLLPSMVLKAQTEDTDQWNLNWTVQHDMHAFIQVRHAVHWSQPSPTPRGKWQTGGSWAQTKEGTSCLKGCGLCTAPGHHSHWLQNVPCSDANRTFIQWIWKSLSLVSQNTCLWTLLLSYAPLGTIYAVFLSLNPLNLLSLFISSYTSLAHSISFFLITAVFS